MEFRGWGFERVRIWHSWVRYVRFGSGVSSRREKKKHDGSKEPASKTPAVLEANHPEREKQKKREWDVSNESAPKAATVPDYSHPEASKEHKEKDPDESKEPAPMLGLRVTKPEGTDGSSSQTNCRNGSAVSACPWSLHTRYLKIAPLCTRALG